MANATKDEIVKAAQRWYLLTLPVPLTTAEVGIRYNALVEAEGALREVMRRAQPLAAGDKVLPTSGYHSRDSGVIEYVVPRRTEGGYLCYVRLDYNGEVKEFSMSGLQHL